MDINEITGFIKKRGLTWIVPVAITVIVAAYIYKGYKEMQILKQQYILNKYQIAEYQSKNANV